MLAEATAESAAAARVPTEAAVAMEATAELARLSDGAHRFSRAAEARQLAMRTYMWEDEAGVWRDLEISTGGSLVGGGGVVSGGFVSGGFVSVSRLPQLSVASFAPLWAGGSTLEESARAVRALTSSGLLQPGGVATTLVHTGEQWDWPNAWPPLQQMLIEGLERCGAPGGKVHATATHHLNLLSPLRPPLPTSPNPLTPLTHLSPPHTPHHPSHPSHPTHPSPPPDPPPHPPPHPPHTPPSHPHPPPRNSRDHSQSVG